MFMDKFVTHYNKPLCKSSDKKAQSTCNSPLRPTLNEENWEWKCINVDCYDFNEKKTIDNNEISKRTNMSYEDILLYIKSYFANEMKEGMKYLEDIYEMGKKFDIEATLEEQELGLEAESQKKNCRHQLGTLSLVLRSKL